MRDAAEVTLRHSEDAPKGSCVKYKSIDQQIYSGKEENLSWYSTVQRRLSRTTSSGELGGSDVVRGTCSWSDVIALIGRRGLVAISMVLFLLLLVSCTSTAMLFRTWAAVEKDAGTPGASKYLREIAEWHEVNKHDPAAPALVDLEVSIRACAKRVQLPDVQLPKQLPMVPAWQPDGKYPATPLDGLALNCSNPAETSSCEIAASSNLYEGESHQLDPVELADLEAFLEAQSQHQVAREQNSAAASQQGLAELDLDCTADPDACAAVAEGSNSYYASTETDNLAAASEAAAYLQAVRPANAWDAVMGAAAAKQAAEADNSYESEEQRWVQKRLAEEAGPQYLDASALDLDCSGAADDDTAAECERTKAVNSYEAAPTSVLDPALLAAEIAFSMQQYHRTVGYDAVAVDWADYGTQKTPDTATKPHSCNHAHSEEAVKTSQKLLKLQQQLQEIIRQGRVTGYDAPAIDPDQQLLNAALKPVSAASPAAAAVGVVTIGSAKSVQRVELQAVRQYYKNPCNNPDAQYYYKSSFDYPGHRVYYKNPANAPIYLHEEGTAVTPDKQTPASCAPARSGLMTLLAVLATFAASAGGTWYVLAHSHKNKSKSKEQAEAMGREGLQPTSTLTSTMSCELPALGLATSSGVPQHMPIRSPTMSMPLPTINEPEDDDMDYILTNSGYGAGSSSQALIEGMTSGMLRFRESDSDAILVTAPSMLQTRPSMLVDVQFDYADSPRARTPTVGWDSPNCKGK